MAITDNACGNFWVIGCPDVSFPLIPDVTPEGFYIIAA